MFMYCLYLMCMTILCIFTQFCVCTKRERKQPKIALESTSEASEHQNFLDS